jgi:hypothetical protein
MFEKQGPKLRSARRWSFASGVFAFLHICTIAANPTAIEVGLVVSGTLANTEAESSYVVELQARPYLVVVEQRGLDLQLYVEGDDKRSRSVDSPLGRAGREFLFYHPVAAGEYLLRIASNELADKGGAYEINVFEVTDSDGAGWLALSTAGEAHFAISESGWEAAADAYRLASQAWSRTTREDIRAYADLCEAAIRYLHGHEWQRPFDLASVAEQTYLGVDERMALAAGHLRAEALLELAKSSDTPESAAKQFFDVELFFTRYAASMAGFDDVYGEARGLYSLQSTRKR